MKVLLINPVYPDRPRFTFFPLGLAYIANALIQAKYEVEVFDISALGLSEKETLTALSKARFDAAGIGGLVTAYGHIKWLLENLKKIRPGAPLIVGGGLACSLPELVLGKTAANIAVIGEGEVTMVELLKALEYKTSLSEIKGIYFKDNGRIFKNPAREPIADLDAVAFPAWDLFPIKEYISNMQQYSYCPLKTMVVLTSRSCPFRCNFCYHPIGQTVRVRSPENIVEELKSLASKYGVGYIRFYDELFTINKKKTMELCALMARKKLNLKWQCTGRVNNADLELYQEMREAGNVNINFGIESGNDSILNAMQKDSNVALSEKGIDLARKAGIEPETSFMFGTFGEDEDTIKDTVNFIKRNNLYVPRLFFTTPYPRAPIYDESVRLGLINDEEKFLLKLGNASDFTINLTRLPDKKLKKLKSMAEKDALRHYFRKNKADILKISRNSHSVTLAIRCLLPRCSQAFEAVKVTKADDIVHCQYCSKAYYLTVLTRIRMFGLWQLLGQACSGLLKQLKPKIIAYLPNYKKMRREKYWLSKKEFLYSLRSAH